jgi:hypothetical protein
MVDTDKYEGHSGGPWPWVGWAYGVSDTDKQLLADAPLLLEEVKRLRKQLAKANRYVYTICQHSDSMLMDYEDYMGDEEE